jgi:hypothetical protein
VNGFLFIDVATESMAFGVDPHGAPIGFVFLGGADVPVAVGVDESSHLVGSFQFSA